jgi:hypothetical protein
LLDQNILVRSIGWIWFILFSFLNSPTVAALVAWHTLTAPYEVVFALASENCVEVSVECFLVSGPLFVTLSAHKTSLHLAIAAIRLS